MISIEIDDHTLAEARLHLRAFGYQNVGDEELRIAFMRIIRQSYEPSSLTAEVRKLKAQQPLGTLRRPPMTEYWRVEATFPLNTDTMIEDTNKMAEIVGLPVSDAGSLLGSGVRDVGWTFFGEAAANAARDKLHAAGYTTAHVSKHVREGS